MIDIKNGIIKCPQCGRDIDLAGYKVVIEKSEHSPTGDIVTVLDQNSNIATIDFSEDKAHTVNCKFYLNKAYVQTLS